jgi:two-component system sporulation sensor kinase A
VGPEVRLSASAADGLALIRVQDNGSGMTQEQRSRLFKPFHTTKERGTGLGLVISRKLVARMSGTIAVESEEGVGTTVTIALPESRAEA